MSHAEVFGHFRSFAVGLERNARALRRVLEEQAGGSKRKLTNGEFAAEYARALECAAPEVTAKELVAEVAELETTLQGVEVEMGAQGPIDVMMENYKALAEYNELAFVDLENRLSAYGYVRPKPSAIATAPTADSGTPGFVPSSSQNTGGCPRQRDQIQPDNRDAQASLNIHSSDASRGRTDETDGTDLQGNLDNDVTLEERELTSHQRRNNAEAQDAAKVGVDDTSNIDEDKRAGLEGVFIATPVRPTAVMFDGSEDDDDSPATPTLAEWEISEETREALRLDQRARQGQGGGIGDLMASKTGPHRSLEALLAESSIATGENGKQAEGVATVVPAADGSNRFSLSSDWSPPHVHAPSGTGPRDSVGYRGCASTVPGGNDSPAAGVALDNGMVSMITSSPWDSDPPTPRMPSLEGIMCDAGSPAGWAARGGDRDRNSSVETPRRLFTSPMKTPMGRSLLNETLTTLGKRSELPPSDNPVYTSGTDGEPDPAPGTPVEQTPRRGLAQEASENSPSEVPPAESRDRLWGGAHPGADTPGTPRTPQMLSPRHDVAYVEKEKGYCAATKTAAATAHCAMDAEIGGFSSDYSRSNNSNSGGGGDPGGPGGARGSDDDDLSDRSCQGGHDEHNDDCCQTPELPSPPRTDVTAGEDAVAADAALCRKRLEEADDSKGDTESPEVSRISYATTAAAEKNDGPLERVSEEEYARAPTFLTIQVSRELLNDAIHNLNAYAAPRLATPSEMLLTLDEIVAVIDQGELSRTLLLSAAHLKRVEFKGSKMYRIRGALG